MQAQHEHTAFKRIIGGGFPLYRYGEDHVAFEHNLQAKGRVMQQAGITHVQINGGLVSARRAQDPENSYLMWAVPGQTMDEIVSSDYNRGILPESILQLNQDILKQNAAYARRFGFKPIIWFVEPYFMPESFYQRWPDLRGPRVDNPFCSRKPLFAPCVALPKAQDHYRLLARNLLRLAPEIEQIHMFTNDSGAGICYSRYLYPGSNGPGHCRDISPARHVSLLLNAILEGAREVNPKARVIMECGLHPAETKELADLLPSEGIYPLVYGALSWGSGLEDCWGTMMHGSASEKLREETRAFQRKDFATRVQWAGRKNREVYARFNTIGAGFETHAILRQYRNMGVTHLMGICALAPNSAQRWDINGEVLRRFRHNPEADAANLIRDIARAWVGDKHAERLYRAWKLWDTASRTLPVLGPDGHFLTGHHDLVSGPLVSDFERLQESELDYYHTAWMKEYYTMHPAQGGVWRIVHYEDGEKTWFMKAMEQQIFPVLDDAERLLKTILKDKHLTDRARDCVDDQLCRLEIFGCTHRRSYHWILATAHTIKGTRFQSRLSMPAIVGRDIANEHKLALALNRHKPVGETPRERVMRRHRRERVRVVDLSAFESKRPAGWKGAPASFEA